MPPRPDPETGLIPSAPTRTPPYEYGSPPFRIDYPQLVEPPSRPSRDDARVSTTNRVTQEDLLNGSLRISAQRDLARGGVQLQMCNVNYYGDTVSVIENITWRTIQPGEEVTPSAMGPLFLTQEAVERLVEQLGNYSEHARRANQFREQRDNAQTELRSLANQLTEIRNHNETLVRTNDEQQRQIRWLERELRDANQERRAQS